MQLFNLSMEFGHTSSLKGFPNIFTIVCSDEKTEDIKTIKQYYIVSNKTLCDVFKWSFSKRLEQVLTLAAQSEFTLLYDCKTICDINSVIRESPQWSRQTPLWACLLSKQQIHKLHVSEKQLRTNACYERRLCEETVGHQHLSDSSLKDF